MKPKKVCAVGSSLFLVILGILIALISPFILKAVINAKLILTPDSPILDIWQHFPSLVPMDFYIFNWTNPDQIYNKSVKPQLQEMGPYRFLVDMKKSNISWNDNGTVTYKMMNHFYYDQEHSKGDLQDRITLPNVVAVGAAHVSRTWNYYVRRGLSISLQGLGTTISVTRTAEELLFEGYPDRLLKIAKALPFFVNTDMPDWDKFGYFYQRNGTTDFDGTYNVGTGRNSTFGKLYNWNYASNTPFYGESCSQIDGTSVERFDLSDSKQFIKIFSPYLCRPITLEFTEQTEVFGITGYKYILNDYTLDNGTKYETNKCYCDGECRPSGIFNVSSCRWGMPAFASLPHFYQADPHYNGLIEGTAPREGNHELSVIIEPNTGIALDVKIRLQINLMLHHVDYITLFENVPEVFMPVMWFDNRVQIPQSQVATIKKLVNIQWMCTAFGVLISILGLVSLVYFVLFRKKAKKLLRDSEPLKPRNDNGTRR